MSASAEKTEVWLERREARWAGKRSGKTLRQIKRGGMSEDLVACVCKCAVCDRDSILDGFQVLPGNPLWISGGSALFLLHMESIINGHLEDFIGIQ